MSRLSPERVKIIFFGASRVDSIKAEKEEDEKEKRNIRRKEIKRRREKRERKGARQEIVQIR